MQVIDSRGKVFGKANVIDLLVVTSIIIGFLIGAKILFFSPKTTTYVVMQLCEGYLGNTVNLVNCGSVPYFVKDAVAPGDTIKSFGKVVAEVTDVDVEDKKHFTKDMLLQVRVLADEKNDGLHFMNQVLKVNSPIYLESPKMNLFGVVIKLNPERTNITRFYETKGVEILVSGMEPELFRVLGKGLIEMDATGKVVAEIVDFKTVSESGVSKDVLIKAKLLVKYFDGEFWFKDSPFKILAPVEIQTPQITINGSLVNISVYQDDNRFMEGNLSYATSNPMQNVSKNIKVMLYQQKPWIENAIHVGDKEVDNKSSVLAEVLSKQAEYSEIEVTTGSGEVQKRSSPIFKDITLRVRVLAEEDARGYLIFHDSQLKAGKSVYLSFPLVDINGIVTEIE